MNQIILKNNVLICVQPMLDKNTVGKSADHLKSLTTV